MIWRALGIAAMLLLLAGCRPYIPEDENSVMVDEPMLADAADDCLNEMNLALSKARSQRDVGALIAWLGAVLGVLCGGTSALLHPKQRPGESARATRAKTGFAIASAVGAALAITGQYVGNPEESLKVYRSALGQWHAARSDLLKMEHTKERAREALDRKKQLEDAPIAAVASDDATAADAARARDAVQQARKEVARTNEELRQLEQAVHQRLLQCKGEFSVSLVQPPAPSDDPE